MAVKTKIKEGTNTLMTKMQKMLKQAEVKDDQARLKRAAAKKRKEVAKVEEQEKHKQKNRNIKEMMEIWGGGRKANETGNPPKTNDLVRKRETRDAGGKAK